MTEFDTQIIPTARAMSFLFSGRVQLSKCAKNFTLPAHAAAHSTMSPAVGHPANLALLVSPVETPRARIATDSACWSIAMVEARLDLTACSCMAKPLSAVRRGERQLVCMAVPSVRRQPTVEQLSGFFRLSVQRMRDISSTKGLCPRSSPLAGESPAPLQY